MRWFEQAVIGQWQSIPGDRRAVIMVTLWSLAMVALWQFAWVPGKQRLQQAELAHAHELRLTGHLQRVSTGPSMAREAVRVLTPGGLNERALAAGLQIIGLQIRAGQVDVSLEGEPVPLLGWLHALERDGAQVRSLQLQVVGEQLHAQLGLALDEARAD
ncbi:General secretion pathway, M protein [compost metagenome]